MPTTAEAPKVTRPSYFSQCVGCPAVERRIGEAQTAGHVLEVKLACHNLSGVMLTADMKGEVIFAAGEGTGKDNLEAQNVPCPGLTAEAVSGQG